MNVLVISAHPDDEIIGLGGTLCKHVENGDDVFVHILTDGHSSRSDYALTDAEYETMAVRKQAAMAAARTVGLKDVLVDEFPDQSLDTLPMVHLVKAIERVAEKVRPDVVFTHHRGDANYDHQVVFHASITAFRPVGGHYPRALYCYETLSSTEWGAPFADAAFVPDYFVDISRHLETKLAAMRCYADELRDYPHPRSLEGIRDAARRWGKVISVDAAEAFQTVRRVWR